MFSRRHLLQSAGMGFGSLALSAMVPSLLTAGDQEPRSLVQPLKPRQGHHKARAKNVIFLFMEGGPSHIDMFDPKPELNRLAGQTLPDSFGSVLTAMGESRSPLLACPRTFKQHGQSGIWMSDWLPHLATCADDLAVIRSCVADGINHSSGICQMNTGSILAGRPSLGAWTTYGLGSENQDLPGFVVMQDNATTVVNGPRNWGAGFMPAVYQGTAIDSGTEPITHLTAPASISPERQQQKLDLLNTLNRSHAAMHHQSELEARIASYELAFRMQAEAPDAVDVSKESKATKELYGLNNKETERFGGMCLLARRLVERGVRFVQLYHGAGNKWDGHSNLEKNHSKLCSTMDQPVAALLKDLKSRGLLDETLVIWGGEFGRTPMSEKGTGRDHNPTGFTMWMAGGGVKGGQTIGSTDELGLRAVEDRLHVHDIHATILWLLGLDHMRVVYNYKGRPERPTLNEGEAYTKIAGV